MVVKLRETVCLTGIFTVNDYTEYGYCDLRLGNLLGRDGGRDGTDLYEISSTKQKVTSQQKKPVPAGTSANITYMFTVS